jgi:hypothetical protein
VHVVSEGTEAQPIQGGQMIIGLSGYARSGKDTVAELLVLNYGFKRMAFADGIRQALLTLNPILQDDLRLNDVVDEHGWEVAKSKDEVRRLLQVMGTEVGRKLIHEDVWVWRLFNSVKEGERIVIPDVRFPNEAQMIESQGGEVWRINRHNHSAVNDHISEHAMDNHMFKRAIYNDGTLDDLADEIFMLMHNVYKL